MLPRHYDATLPLRAIIDAAAPLLMLLYYFVVTLHYAVDILPPLDYASRLRYMLPMPRRLSPECRHSAFRHYFCVLLAMMRYFTLPRLLPLAADGATITMLTMLLLTSARRVSLS